MNGIEKLTRLLLQYNWILTSGNRREKQLYQIKNSNMILKFKSLSELNNFYVLNIAKEEAYEKS